MKPNVLPPLRRFFMRLFAAFSLGGLAASAATWTVTDLSDAPSAPAVGTLRQAIAAAAPGDTIQFAAGLTGLIKLGGSELDLTKDLTITGPGTDNLEISGNQASRIFYIASGVSVTISGVKISNGKASFPTSTVEDNGGGGILNLGHLSVTACTFQSNVAGEGTPEYSLDLPPVIQGGGGGAIANAAGATLMVDGCQFAGNYGGAGGAGGPGISGGRGGAGGAIANFSSLATAVQITNSGFSGNHAGAGGSIAAFSLVGVGPGGPGGALFSGQGGLTITGCTFYFNITGDGGHGSSPATSGETGPGGALALTGGTTVLTNCTFTYNSTTAIFYSSFKPSKAGDGGGIYSTAEVALVSCTFSYNTAGIGSDQPHGQGDSIFQLFSGSASLRNTLVGPGGLAGTFVSLGHNLVPSAAGITGFGNGDLVVNPLFPVPAYGNHGGPTYTELPAIGSPSVDAGDDTLTGTDQRGFPRRVGAHVDIGAVEREDESPGVIQFAQASSGVQEGAGQVNVVVTRTAGFAAGETVQYSMANGSATDEDYSAASGTLTFAAGETQKIVQIPIVNDAVAEPDETFTVTLSSPGGGASLGGQTTHTVTIQNDDAAPPSPGVIQFAQTASSVEEGAGVVSVVVMRTGGSSAGETVAYSTMNVTVIDESLPGLSPGPQFGSATGGVDYSVTSGILTFAAGETQKVIQIPIGVDTAVEPAELFAVALSSPGGGASLGAQTTHTVTIQNDDHVVSFAWASVEVSEGAGKVSLELRMTGVSDLPVTVQVATSDGGTAKAGIDYEPVSTSVTFPPGVYTRTIVVPLINNTEADDFRAFGVSVNAPSTGPAIGANPVVSVFILDDEETSVDGRAGFHGLAQRSDAPGWGSFVVNKTGASTVTGMLQIDGATYRFSGSFGPNNAFTRAFMTPGTRKGPLQTLTFHTADNGARVTGHFYAAPGISYDLTAERDAIGSAASPVAQAGRYTAILSSDLSGPVRGYLTANVLPNGQVRLLGALPDGTTLSQTTRVSESGALGIYVPLYVGGHGCLAGPAGFDASASLSWSGDLAWKKPAANRGLYADGLDYVPVDLDGARYVPHPGHAPLDDFDATAGAGMVDFSGGELADPVQASFQWKADRALVLPPNPQRVLFSVAPATGIITGTFTDSHRHRRPFKGVCVQQDGEDLAEGFFLGTETAGLVQIHAGSP